MSIRTRAIIGGAIVAFAAAPGAAEAAKKRPAKVSVSSLGAVPVSVTAGSAFSLEGRVANAKKRRASRVQLTYQLRTLARKKVIDLKTRRLSSLKGGRSRAFSDSIIVPASVAEGTYLVYACVKRTSGGATRCRIAIGRLDVKPLPVPPVPDNRTPSEKLRTAITAAGMTEHLKALQRISDTFGGNRASGLPGYQHSVEHIVDELKAAGYDPQTQIFPFVLFSQDAPSNFERTSAPATEFDEADEDTPLADADYALADYSGEGTATGTVVGADLDLAAPPAQTTGDSGCQDADFAGFTPGAIALVRRGDCTFGEKAVNAEQAGASAVIIMNAGDDPDDASRSDVFSGTLGQPVGIPVVTVSYALGVQLSAGGTAVTITADTTNDARTSTNVWADTPGGDANNVIVAGGHLDSVEAGAGINDNGTGTAFVLEAAIQMAKLGITPTKKVRFMFYGAEESGLIGSTYYVDNLPEAELAKIKGMLNFDMLGSPNHAKFVYDGNFSDTDSGGLDVNAGAAEIERLFVEYFTAQGIPTEPTAFDGRSDYEAFQLADIPSGGLFSGAEVIKSAEQAAKWGGTAGQAFDPCYHLGCDTLANVDFAGFEQLADGGAHVLATLATRQSNPGAGMAGQGRKSGQRKRSLYSGSHLQR